MSLFPSVPDLYAQSIVKTQSLAGCKKAVQIGDGPIHVSPAMYSLIMGAKDDPEELRKILGAIKVLRLPKGATMSDLSGVMFTPSPSGKDRTG